MSHEYTILKDFAEKISAYTLPFDVLEELNDIKLQIEIGKNSPQMLISHLSSFLHYLYLFLGSNASFIEPLIVEMQSILFGFKKKQYTKDEAKFNTENFLSLKDSVPKHDYANISQINISPDKDNILLNTESEISMKSASKKHEGFLENRKKSNIKSLRDEQKRLNKNIKFNNFLRKVWRYTMIQNMPSHKIFISYAWPIQDKYSERWTKNFIKSLSTHLCQAGVHVYLDEFHSGGGYPLRKFMQNIGNMDHVLVISTRTMRKKLSLENSGVKYEATQIKKHLENKNRQFVINVLLDKVLHSDPDFHHYPQISFIDENIKSTYYEILGDLLAKLYHFEGENYAHFKKFYIETYKNFKIDADLWHVGIHSAFQVKRNDLTNEIKNSENHIVVLHGKSGSGKSELVRQYVWDNYAQYQTVYWFDASSLECFKKDFFLLMQSKNNFIENNFLFDDCFIAWLKDQKNCLIVFDNWMIEDASFMEKTNSYCINEKSNKIIIATKQITKFDAYEIEVGDYTDVQSRAYIQMTLGEQNEEDIMDLVIDMGKSPYHLACACGHIQRQSQNIRNFLDYYKKLGDKLFARPLFPIPAKQESVKSDLSKEERYKNQIEEKLIEINLLDDFLTLSEENLSGIGKAAQLFLKTFYDQFKAIDYKNYDVLSRIVDSKIGLQIFSEQEIPDDLLIRYIDFIVSHLNALAPHFKTLYLTDLISMGEDFLKNYFLKVNAIALEISSKSTNIENNEKPAIVVETEDSISVEMVRYQEQDKLDKLTNIERSGYENAFKLFLNDLWVYALNQQCRSKKVYLFCLLPEGAHDERWWMQSYIENLKKHLSYAGFSVYPDDIAQSLDASEEFLNEMDHVIAISNPMMKINKRDKEKNSIFFNKESEFDAQIHKLAKLKPERFRLPFLTGNVNHLNQEWRNLAEFSFFKNDYLNAFQSLVRMLYGLDQIGGFNPYYKQRLLYHSILNNQWHVPDRTQHFIGRESQLETIKQKLQQEGQQVIVLTASGMGGVGKTQLTLQYIHLHGHEYQKIYWVDATSADSIKLAYAELAEHLKIPLTDEEQKSIDLKAECVKRTLEKKNGWLIIYDNALNESTVEKFKPVQGGKILVTSRNTVWNNVISVEVFTEAEAEKYIMLVLDAKIVQKEYDLEKSLKGLMNISGRLPIALVLICAYINKQGISLENYIAIYEVEKSELSSSHSITQVMTAIWKITAEKIQEESPGAIKLINFCSLLHHEAIPEYLGKYFFEQFVEDSAEKGFLVDMTVDEAKRISNEYSILKFNPEKKYFSLHLLIQEVIKIQLKVDGILPEYLRTVIVSLFNGYPYGKDQNTDIQLKRELLSHLETMLKNCDENSNKLNEEKDRPQLESILDYLGDAYRTLGDLQKSKKLLERVLIFNEEYYGKDHYEVAITLTDLGVTYFSLGDVQKGKELLERALIIKEKHCSKDHYQVALTLEALGSAYSNLGDLQKGKNLIERALLIKEEHYGKDHPHVSFTLRTLGIIYGQLEDMQKSKKLLERALSIFEKDYGKDHYQVAVTLTNLGIAYGELGDVQKKKVFLERALNINEKHYGKDHFQVAITLTNLGNTYYTLGDSQKSKELLERALIIDEKHYGKDYYPVAITLRSLGIAYGSLGYAQKSKDLFERALNINEKHYGKDHWEVGITLTNLGIAYGDLGDALKKKELLECALIINEKYYGKSHYQVAVTLGNLSDAYYSLGDAQKSKELFERALSIQKNRFGNGNTHINDKPQPSLLNQQFWAQTKSDIDIDSKLNNILKKLQNKDETSPPSLEVALRRAAAGFGLEGGLAYLIKKVSNINAASPTNGKTALHFAIIRGKKENVALLLAAKADINIRDSRNKAAIEYDSSGLIEDFFLEEYSASIINTEKFKCYSV